MLHQTDGFEILALFQPFIIDQTSEIGSIRNHKSLIDNIFRELYIT